MFNTCSDSSSRAAYQGVTRPTRFLVPLASSAGGVALVTSIDRPDDDAVEGLAVNLLLLSARLLPESTCDRLSSTDDRLLRSIDNRLFWSTNDRLMNEALATVLSGKETLLDSGGKETLLAEWEPLLGANFCSGLPTESILIENIM